MVPSKEKRNSPESIHEANRLVRIADRCPSCGSQNLFIGSEGWITCGWIECKEPGLTRNLAAHQQAMREAQLTNERLSVQRDDLQNRLVASQQAMQGLQELTDSTYESYKEIEVEYDREKQRADRLQAQVKDAQQEAKLALMLFEAEVKRLEQRKRRILDLDLLQQDGIAQQLAEQRAGSLKESK